MHMWGLLNYRHSSHPAALRSTMPKRPPMPKAKSYVSIDDHGVRRVSGTPISVDQQQVFQRVEVVADW